MKDNFTPKKGTVCPALTKEDYTYNFSGDCTKSCICMVSGKACTGRVISDPNNASSQFVSRAKCSMSREGLKECVMYGWSKERFVWVIKDNLEKELDEKLEYINSFKDKKDEKA